MKIKHADIKRIKKFCKKYGVVGVHDLDLDIEDETYTFYDDNHVMYYVDMGNKVIKTCK